MISIPDALPRRPGAAWLVMLCVGALSLLAGCNTNYNLGATGSVGVGSSVAITTAGNVTQLYQGGALPVIATVANDTSNQGVTWAITGAGTLSGSTNDSVTYVAPPSGVIGATTAQITATSIADPSNVAEVTLVTLGSPVMNAGGSASNPGELFPGNVNVAYAAQITVEGGTAPFTWDMVSGSTVPAGLTLNGSTSAVTTITGTPTTAGSYNFSVQATDANGLVASEQLTMVVNAQTACLLSGQYTLTFSGSRGGGAATHVANITIGSTGTISGEQDYKDGHRTTPDETLLSTSYCQNISTNAGYLHLYSASGQLNYTFAATPPDASGVIHAARLQLVGSGADSGSGQLMLTDTAALTATIPSGNFAFGLLGVDNNYGHYGTIGRFTSDTSGNLSAGLVDSNGTSASSLGGSLAGAALTGTLSAPDALGRGTLTITAGSTSSQLVYYIVNANKMFLLNINPPVTTARESGFLTAQVGNVTATNTFDNGAFSSPSIMSLWGNVGNINPSTVAALGRLANGNPTGGTVDVTLDVSSQTSATANLLYTAQSYSVAASGRGTLTLTDSSGNTPLVFYLDGTANGYILQPGTVAGNSGLLEAQSPPPTDGYAPTLAGTFVGGTQYPQAAGPVTLISLVYIDYGALSSTYTNGTFSVDPVTGRGFGQISFSGVGAVEDVMYIVSPDKVDLMNYGTTTGINSSIDWLIQ